MNSKIRLLWLLLSVGLLVNPAFGQVYKCRINGTTVFAERPCGSNAEQLDISLEAEEVQPDVSAEELERYRANVQSQKERAALASHNADLEKQIRALRRQANSELNELQIDRDACAYNTPRTDRNTARWQARVKQCTDTYDVRISAVEQNRDEQIAALEQRKMSATE